MSFPVEAIRSEYPALSLSDAGKLNHEAMAGVMACGPV